VGRFEAIASHVKTMLLKRPTEALLLCSRAFLLVGRRPTMEKKKRFKHPSKKDQTTDLTLLKEMNKRLGIREIPAPKTVQVWFTGPIIVSDEVV
jgi:hypothetical protein